MTLDEQAKIVENMRVDLMNFQHGYSLLEEAGLTPVLMLRGIGYVRDPSNLEFHGC